MRVAPPGIVAPWQILAAARPLRRTWQVAHRPFFCSHGMRSLAVSTEDTNRVGEKRSGDRAVGFKPLLAYAVKFDLMASDEQRKIRF